MTPPARIVGSVSALAALLLVAGGGPVGSGRREVGWQQRGQIVVWRHDDIFQRNGAMRLLVAEVDGTGCNEVLRLPEGTFDVYVAPDGRSVAYVVRETAHRPRTLFVSALDGEGARVLATGDITVTGWANDRLLVYDERAETVIANAAPRGRPTRLSLPASRTGSISLSPDGRRLVFARLWRNAPGSWHVALVVRRVDGTGDTRELYRGDARNPDPPEARWAPDGRRILILDAGRMFTVRPDGTNLRGLTPLGHGTDDLAPMWSADARRILFSSNRHAPASGEEDYPMLDIYVMDSDGGGLRRLTFTKSVGVNPRSAWGIWSPDGRAFAFQRHLSAAVLGLDRTGGRAICPAPLQGDVELLPVAWAPPVSGSSAAVP
jgi:hypothetical protein